MDPEHYKLALERGAGIPLEAGKREKLEKLDAGMLTPLKEQILEHGQEIEQELLLLVIWMLCIAGQKPVQNRNFRCMDKRTVVQ